MKPRPGRDIDPERPVVCTGYDRCYGKDMIISISWRMKRKESMLRNTLQERWRPFPVFLAISPRLHSQCLWSHLYFCLQTMAAHSITRSDCIPLRSSLWPQGYANRNPRPIDSSNVAAMTVCLPSGHFQARDNEPPAVTWPSLIEMERHLDAIGRRTCWVTALIPAEQRDIRQLLQCSRKSLVTPHLHLLALTVHITVGRDGHESASSAC